MHDEENTDAKAAWLETIYGWVADIEDECIGFKKRVEARIVDLGRIIEEGEAVFERIDEDKTAMELIRKDGAVCQYCGRTPVVCFGDHEGPGFSCENCCGHGVDEDRWCVPLAAPAKS